MVTVQQTQLGKCFNIYIYIWPINYLFYSTCFCLLILIACVHIYTHFNKHFKHYKNVKVLRQMISMKCILFRIIIITERVVKERMYPQQVIIPFVFEVICYTGCNQIYENNWFLKNHIISCNSISFSIGTNIMNG